MSAIVSVVIPTWNRHELLERAVASVQAQTYSPIEIIVVDDGSDIQVSLKSGGSISRVYHRPHLGISAAINFGLARANGELICILGSDDEMKPELIATEAIFILDNPNVDMCYTDSISTNAVIQRFDRIPDYERYATMATGIPHGCALWRSEIIRRIPHDETLPSGIDYEFIMQAFEAGVRMSWVPGEPLWILNVGPHPRECGTKRQREGVRISLRRRSRPIPDWLKESMDP